MSIEAPINSLDKEKLLIEIESDLALMQGWENEED